MTARYTGVPHPDYPNMVWSTDTVELLVLPVIEGKMCSHCGAHAVVTQERDAGPYRFCNHCGGEAVPDTPERVARGVMKVLDSVGYDSMDREMAFWIASQTKGWDYDDIYDAWLETVQ